MAFESLEEIGALTVAYYKAERARLERKQIRAEQRRAHPCVVVREYYEDDTGANGKFCWRTPNQVDWCENCLTVQPYHEQYMLAAKDARRARYNLTRKIQRRITP